MNSDRSNITTATTSHPDWLPSTSLIQKPITTVHPSQHHSTGSNNSLIMMLPSPQVCCCKALPQGGTCELRRGGRSPEGIFGNQAQFPADSLKDIKRATHV
ncbi:hypothetical protein PGT21_015388 [Puccinia graminis f. sp. tritici]|uniref:Uncharacterized protein n=1 Tax=Puccinia graminis f. sp. tritici TaxID=56615 RepID=A0A5B0NVZ3_PUCGR|nr:hypothetical protein PGT21_015388 [Puccinia graminis f. sp. tritici]